MSSDDHSGRDDLFYVIDGTVDLLEQGRTPTSSTRCERPGAAARIGWVGHLCTRRQGSPLPIGHAVPVTTAAGGGRPASDEVTPGDGRRCRALSAAALSLTFFVLTGCGSSSAGNTEADSPDGSAHVTAQSTLDPDPAASGDGGSPYCEAIHAVVGMPEATVRSDRSAYRATIAAVIESSPPAHRSAWDALLAFIDDDSSEMLNPAADGLEEIGDAVSDECGANLVLEDWDLLRDRPLTDRPGVSER